MRTAPKIDPTQLVEPWQSERLSRHFHQSSEVMLQTLNQCAFSILAAAGLIAHTLSTGGKLLLCGNGGSAADCQHLAAEFVSCLTQDFRRPGLAAVALTTDSSIMSAYANDFGFGGVFARQVEALGRPGDLLIGISTSGNSGNVISAMEQAREIGIKCIALCGSGGAMAELAQVAINVPSNETALIQQAHLAVEHILCDLAERMLFNEEKNRLQANR